MNIAVEIPIKAKASERVENKNFRMLAGKPLCHWLLGEAHQLPAEWHIYIDSEKEDVYRRIIGEGKYDRFRFHRRDPWFASDAANGNHLLTQFAVAHPGYDIYVQLFVTAVTLTAAVISEAVGELVDALDTTGNFSDSVLLATEETGWYWRRWTDAEVTGWSVPHETPAPCPWSRCPTNYKPGQPNGLPRSQDAQLLKETTGLYAVTRESLFKRFCRVGGCPIFHVVDKRHALDIDTEADLKGAERVLAGK